MQVAALLSDLKSLSACPPEAALKLVSVHKIDAAPESSSSPQQQSARPESDPDLERASTLIALHQSVKVKYEESGLDEDLLQAREDVNRILGSLRTKQ